MSDRAAEFNESHDQIEDTTQSLAAEDRVKELESTLRRRDEQIMRGAQLYAEKQQEIERLKTEIAAWHRLTQFSTEFSLGDGDVVKWLGTGNWTAWHGATGRIERLFETPLAALKALDEMETSE